MKKKPTPAKTQKTKPSMRLGTELIKLCTEDKDGVVWFDPLTSLLGMVVGSLVLLSENFYSNQNDAIRLEKLAKVLSAVAKNNLQSRKDNT